MKKYMKIVTVALLMLILISTCVRSFAATVTKESLEESIRGYFTGEKKASTEVDGTEFSINMYSESEPMTLEVTDTTITVNDSVYNYTIEENKVKFSHEINAKDGDPTEIDKLYNYIVFPLLFVSVTDLYGIDSNKSLYYYESVYLANRTVKEEIPEDLKTGNAMSYHKFLSGTDNFKTINNSVFTMHNEILEETDTNIRYTENIEISLNNVEKILTFDETSYQMANTNTETPSISAVSNTTNSNVSSNNDLPYSGLEDENTFIGVALVLIGIALVFYAKYITLKIKEN